MPFDVLGCTRATMTISASFFQLGRKLWQIFEMLSYYGLLIATIRHKTGIPSRRASSEYVDYVPALCTHRPSLLPIGTYGENLGESSSCCRVRFAAPVFKVI